MNIAQWQKLDCIHKGVCFHNGIKCGEFICRDIQPNDKERTCKPVTEVLETVDIGIGFLERLVEICSDCGEPLTCDYSANTPERCVLPNYCPTCGARVEVD